MKLLRNIISAFNVRRLQMSISNLPINVVHSILNHLDLIHLSFHNSIDSSQPNYISLTELASSTNLFNTVPPRKEKICVGDIV